MSQTTQPEHIANAMRVAREMGYHIAFPEARTLADLFTSVTPHEFPKSGKAWHAPRYRHPHAGRQVEVSEFCSVNMPGNRRHLLVRARSEVLAVAAEFIFDAERDSIYFEIVVRDDGAALVIAKSNVILASRWLAFLDAGEITKALGPASE